MTTTPYIPGGGQQAPALAAIAHEEQENPLENFVGSEIFPDVEVASFEGYAPITYDDTLDAYDDDTVGKRADYPEVTIVQAQHKYTIGFHARKFIIDNHDRIKAEQQKALSGGGFDALFDLEARFTRVITGQNFRHNELLKMMELKNTAAYPADNVMPSLAIDTCTADEFLGSILTMAKRVERAQKGPANLIVMGDGASEGALRNPNLRALMPDDAPKVFTMEALLPLLRLPEGQARVRIATAGTRRVPKGPVTPMFDQWVWVGRAGVPNRKGDGFGANLWHPTLDNRQRFFVYRLIVGSPRNIHVSIENFYRPFVNDYALGAIMPTTVAA
jgi:hypothetical protein